MLRLPQANISSVRQRAASVQHVASLQVRPVRQITVSFTIDESENITKGKIANSPDPEVTSVVLKILKESPRWMVPIQNGKPATMHLDLPIIICSVVQKKQSASEKTIRGHLILSFGI